jgi:hypothetical protein
MLKPGGKFFYGMCPYVADNTKDQDIVADLGGFLLPLASEARSRDPFYKAAPAYKPNAATESGRPYTRELMFTYEEYFWSPEKLITKLNEAGFMDVIEIPPSFPEDVPPQEADQIKALVEPFILLGATKP